MVSRKKHATREQKVEWLIAHPEVLKLDHRTIMHRMNAAGLSNSSHPADAHIDELLELVRKRSEEAARV